MIFLSSLTLVGALAYSLLFWQSWSRPGMRHYLAGMAAMNRHDAGAAKKEWLAGVQQDPKDYHCYEMLGDYWTELFRFRDAANCYATAARLNSGDGELWKKLAFASRKGGMSDQALAAARKASQLLPADADAQGGYGILLAESKNRPAALAELRRAHELRPSDRRYFIAMVNTEMDSLEINGAERDLTPYLRKHPDDPDACFLMAVVYNQKSRSPQNLNTAIVYAEKALRGNPNDPRTYPVLGQLYLDSNQTEKALLVFEVGRKLAPSNEGMLRGLADCYTRMGRTRELAEVTAEFQKVLARHDRATYLTHVMGFNHHNVTAGLELARLVEEDGKTSLARTYFEQLARQAPQDPRTVPALRAFYQRQGLSPDGAALRPGAR